MLTVDTQLIYGILKRYVITGDIVSIDPLINAQKIASSPEETRLKVIIRVGLQNGQRLIIKMVKEKEHPEYIMNQQSIFSETLRRSGIRVPARYLTDEGKYCYSEELCGYRCSITIEEALSGKELEVINEGYVDELAGIMAAMHTASMENDCHISLNTIWDIFDPESDIQQGYQLYTSLSQKYGSCPGVSVSMDEGRGL